MAKYHFIGIGGIGMSALAAFCRHRGDEVTGSDRSYGKPENQKIFAPLEKCGVKIFSQDGSFAASGKPDFIVYSSAIEEDNPDLAAARNVPKLHRSMLLSEAVTTFPGKSIAVTGSCGKSSVTTYIAEALSNCGIDPDVINGALMKKFITPEQAGNFHPGDGSCLVLEADESDKSLLNYAPDYAVVLNLGHDHYEEAELLRVFAQFLNSVKVAAVIEENVYEKVKNLLRKDLKLVVFGGKDAPLALTSYKIIDSTPVAEISGKETLHLPQCGRHTAMNSLAVLGLLDLLGIPREKSLPALEKFSGVWRRNDFAGTTDSGAKVFDDYAHNPEKIISCLGAMREITPGNLYAIYQPHGYGPFGFMRDTLFEELEKFLKESDRFFLLEPYYAGGTSSFKPTAAEVMESWLKKSAKKSVYILGNSRNEVKKLVLDAAQSGDTIVIMGARDNSLSDYAAEFTAPKSR